jgi:hypothetical protein
MGGKQIFHGAAERIQSARLVDESRIGGQKARSNGGMTRDDDQG